jgi:hypothetical protein
MIGFDLDGVLVADVTWSPEAVKFRNLGMNPVFIPEGRYAIITSRPNATEDTETWVKRELSDNPPEKLFSGNTDWKLSIQYKVKILRENPYIDTYVESDKTTVMELRSAFPDRRILHFSTWINHSIRNLNTPAKATLHAPV